MVYALKAGIVPCLTLIPVPGRKQVHSTESNFLSQCGIFSTDGVRKISIKFYEIVSEDLNTYEPNLSEGETETLKMKWLAQSKTMSATRVRCEHLYW